MEHSATSSFAKTGQGLADKAADKAQSSTLARDTAKDTGDFLSGKLQHVRSEAGAALNRGQRAVQSATKQGLNAITEMAGQAREVASNASGSIVGYTKKNPVKALAIAAASGALLYAAIKALSPSQD
jgi:ElaB/YqjD/DUF883 family membrane-anchored ribosome-binding protein